jgi:uncharacterized protein (DUF1684 family)
VKSRLLLLVASSALAACSTQPPVQDYAAEVAATRAAKDAMFLQAGDSPVPATARDRFVPLAYYGIDDSYRTPAALVPIDERDAPVLDMPTSTGQRRPMRRAGKLQFSLRGQPHTLTAFVSADDPGRERLFVPFRDLTAGAETYPAGRYLDLDRTATGLYDLDFNRAYQPYCYFDSSYDCPIPPQENRLPVPIRAGERMRS